MYQALPNMGEQRYTSPIVFYGEYNARADTLHKW